MKKIICITLIICLAFTGSSFVALTDKNQQDNIIKLNDYIKFDTNTNTMYIGSGIFDNWEPRYFCDEFNFINTYFIKREQLLRMTKKLVFEEGLERIYKESFHDLPNLEEVVFPSTLKKIEEFAFWNCPKLKIIYGENVTEIGPAAFGRCTSLTYAEFPKIENLKYKKLELDYYSDEYETHVWSYPIHEYYVGAFQECTSLKEINIPKIKKIAPKTFYKCYSLTTINTNNNLDNVTYLGRTAFYGCKSLKSISLKNVNKLTSGHDPIADTKCEGTFGYCTNLESVNIPNVEDISRGSFYCCTKLKRINKNNTMSKVNTLGAYSFAGCKSLENISLPKVKNLSCGKWKCYDKNVLKSFREEAVFTEYYNSCTYNFEKEGEAKYCGIFENCANLKSINIPSAANLGSRLFLNCKNLRKINSNNVSKVKSIGIITFYNCSSLTDISLPNVKTITSKRTGAFENCSNLKSIKLPNAVNIQRKSFANCKKLTAITTSNKLKYIGDYAFYKCSSLKKVTAPKNVTSIGIRAFARCNNLRTINLKTTKLKTVKLDAFKIIYPKATFNCPKNKLKKYKKIIKPNAPSNITFVGKY